MEPVTNPGIAVTHLDSVKFTHHPCHSLTPYTQSLFVFVAQAFAEYLHTIGTQPLTSTRRGRSSRQATPLCCLSCCVASLLNSMFMLLTPCLLSAPSPCNGTHNQVKIEQDALRHAHVSVASRVHNGLVKRTCALQARRLLIGRTGGNGGRSPAGVEEAQAGTERGRHLLVSLEHERTCVCV